MERPPSGSPASPPQARAARERNIQDIRLFYDKADGLIYRVSEDTPTFWVGGDYDGARPLVADNEAGRRGVRETFEEVLRRDPNLEWFRSFMDRVLAGDGFELDDLLEHCRPTQVVRFSELRNW